MSAGELIKKAMIKKDIGTALLAQYTRMSRTHIIHIISDKRSLTVANAVRIANALKNITPNELLHAQIDRLVREEYNKEKTLEKPLIIRKLDNRKAS